VRAGLEAYTPSDLSVGDARLMDKNGDLKNRVGIKMN
jgi:hypothetical protein